MITQNNPTEAVNGHWKQTIKYSGKKVIRSLEIFRLRMNEIIFLLWKRNMVERLILMNETIIPVPLDEILFQPTQQYLEREIYHFRI